MKRNIILFLAMIASFSMMHAITLTQTTDIPDSLYIGIPFYIHLTLPPGVDSLQVVVPDSLPNFQLLEQKRSTEKGKNEFIIKAAAFETGNLQFPALKIDVFKKAVIDSAAIIPFNLNVRSVLPPKAEPKLKDIAGPLNIPWTIWNYLVILLAVLIIGAIIYLLVHYIRKRKKNITVDGKPIIVHPAWQIALDELEALQSQKLLEKGDFLHYHFGLSLILRRFIENYAGFNAVEMTTTEISDNLSLDIFPQRSEILAFLNESDAVKFAKHIPTYEHSDSAYRWLYAYVKSFSEKDKVEPSPGKEKSDA